MAAGHQLKKMAQSRANGHHGVPYRWVDYMPKHWSVYTLIFSTASLLLFCFLFYDMQSSPTSLLLHAGRELGALKAQVSDSYLFSSTARSSPSKIVIGDGSDKNTETAKLLSKEDLVFINSEFEESNYPSAVQTKKSQVTMKPVQKVVAELEEVLEELVVATEGDSSESVAVSTESKKDDVGDDGLEQSNEDTDIADEKTVKKMIAVVALAGDDEMEQSSEDTDIEDEKTVKKMIAEAAALADDDGMEQSFEDTDIEDEKTVMKMIAAADALAEEVPSESSSDTDSTCDWSKGKWVYDEDYPIYKPNTCPFMDGGFRCVENGRPNSDFQKWRWQPDGCDLPRFDAKDMLERLRGSRMVFVGDSIGRNNWESMLCMLSEAVANKSRVYEINGESISKHSGFLIYRFEDYDCTVEYYRSPHLVPQGRAGPNKDPRVRSTLKLDVMDWSNSKWKTADIVIFNTGHWWSFEKTVRGGNFFQEGQRVHLNMSVGEAFERAMTTVARFVEKQMDPSVSQVFFRSYAPVHFKGGTWDHGGTCNADTKPLQKFPFTWHDRTPSVMISRVMEKNVKNPVNFMNITYLSDLRPDGHSSIWQRVPNSPRNHQDCSHWCLPGVPDTWNEILFATLLKNGKGKWANRNNLS